MLPFWLKDLTLGISFIEPLGFPHSTDYGSTYLEALKGCLQIRRNMVTVLKTFIENQ